MKRLGSAPGPLNQKFWGGPNNLNFNQRSSLRVTEAKLFSSLSRPLPPCHQAFPPPWPKPNHSHFEFTLDTVHTLGKSTMSSPFVFWMVPPAVISDLPSRGRDPLLRLPVMRLPAASRGRPHQPREPFLIGQGKLTSEDFIMPIMGNRMMGRRAVTARGKASVHQKNAMRMMV